MSYLCELATKYGTDKIHYTPLYSLLLEGRRQSTHRVLEIGIGTPQAMQHVPGYKPGASLRMWRDYFPNALVYGLDRDERVLFSDERVCTAWADQSNAVYLQRAVGHLYFDLIVDDGSHKIEDQLLTAETLLPYLNVGGLYIIEDVNKPEELSEGLKVPHSVVFVKGALVGRCVVISK